MTRWYPLWARRLVCRYRGHEERRLHEVKRGKGSAVVVVCTRCFGVVDAHTYRSRQFPLPISERRHA